MLACLHRGLLALIVLVMRLKKLTLSLCVKFFCFAVFLSGLENFTK
jgi:hypothetical protein